MPVGGLIHSQQITPCLVALPTHIYVYYQAAIKCYERASALGCVEAKLALGFCYFHGDAVDQNYSKAVECFEEAANLVRPIYIE